MSNAQQIIEEISVFLDKFMLKKNKLTTQDLINFIEEKWQQADDGKYDIHSAYIIASRMANEYIWAKDFDNMLRWLETGDRHSSAKRNPPYIRNYYKGACCLECGNEEKALEFFQLSYNENPDYIFTRSPECYAFFNKHLENPRDLPKREEEDEDSDDSYNAVELKEWQQFFNEGDALVGFTALSDDSDEADELLPEHEKGLEYLKNNQMKILESLLGELLKKYPELQKLYDYPEKDKPDFMPDITDISGFADLLSPTHIYVTSVVKNGIPYIGYLFSCSWDGEHGLGVMTHQERIIEIEGADTAFSTWSAEKDLEKNG